MPFCNNCSKQLNVGYVFCDVCGSPVKKLKDNQYQKSYDAAVRLDTNNNPSWVNTMNNVENLSFWGYFIKCFKLYATSTGRARRKEYWSFILFIAVISMGLEYLSELLKGDSNVTIGNSLQTLFILGSFIPNISVFISRMHDIGKSGYNYFGLFLPIFGWIYVVILLTRDSEQGINCYGNSPKGNNVAIVTK